MSFYFYVIIYNYLLLQLVPVFQNYF